MDNKLMLAVNFRAIDKLTGPLKNILGGSKRAAAATKALREEEKKLKGELNEVRLAMAKSSGNLTWIVNKEKELESALERTNKALKARKDAVARVARLRFGANAVAEKTGKIGQTASLYGTLPAVAFGAASIRAARESAMAMAQTKASIISMGAAAGRTLPQLQQQATDLMKTSLFDDDEILRSVTANLLTFGKVSGPIFDGAQQAIVNLATKLNMELQPATLMVGKALNDPAKGLTALRRSGIQFTASQQQMIKSMVKAGNVAGAQKIMLAELNNQFGGSADAARKADPFAAFLIDFGEFQQAIGEKLMPRLKPLLTILSNLLDRFNALSPATQNTIVTLGVMGAAFGPLMTGVSGLASTFGLLARPISWAWRAFPILSSVIGMAGNTIIAVGRAMLANPIGLAIMAIAGAGYLLYRYWQPISGFFIGLWQKVQSAFSGSAGGILTALFPFIGIPLMIYRNWGTITGFFGNVWSSITGQFNAGVEIVKSLFGALPAWMQSIGKMMMDGLLLAINPLALAAKLIEVAKLGLAAFKNFFGIKSPSRVFMGMGSHITQGLALGLDRGSGAPLRSIGRISRGVVGAAALGMAVPAAFASPQIGDISPALKKSVNRSATSGTRGTGAGGSVVHFNVTITLTGSGNAQKDAVAIKRELDHLLAVQSRTSYADV